MNLAHAIEHHPLRDEKVWGVKVYHSEHDRNPRYSMTVGSFAYNRVPPPVTLAEAFNAYIYALNTWCDVRLIRINAVAGGGWIHFEDEQALRTGNYAPEPLTKEYDRIINAGGKLPASLRPVQQQLGSIDGRPVITTGSNADTTTTV